MILSRVIRLIFKIKLVKIFILPIFLALAFLFLSLFFNPNLPFSLVAFAPSGSDNIENKTTELLAGQKIRGIFKGEEKNLGILALRFNTFNQVHDDRVVFKIKEIY